MRSLRPKALDHPFACLLGVAALAACLVAQPAAARLFAHAARQKDARILVRFGAGVSADAARDVISRAGAREGRTISDLHLRVLHVPRRALRQTLAELKAAPGVADVEQDRTIFRLAGVIPNDPRWPNEWSAVKTNVPTAWTATTGTPGTIVAVIDTGVDPTQPDLQGALVPGYDFANNDSDPNDDLGHGTMVAGVIAARSNNAVGVASYCWRCSIMPLRIFGADGTANAANLISALTWATDHGARVVNMSFGGTTPSDAIQSAIDYAHAHGVVLVGAAGNNGNSVPFYPGAYRGVISVGGSDPNDQLFPWSGFGPWVKVAAPGCNESTARGGSFDTFCGTSSSTPVVSALAALALSYAPTATNDQIEHAIESSAAPIGNVAYGRVDAAGMLATLGAVFPPPLAPSPSTGPSPENASGSTGASSRNSETAQAVRHVLGRARAGSSKLARAKRKVLRHRRAGLPGRFHGPALRNRHPHLVHHWQAPAARRWARALRHSRLFLLVAASSPR